MSAWHLEDLISGPQSEAAGVLGLPCCEVLRKYSGHTCPLPIFLSRMLLTFDTGFGLEKTPVSLPSAITTTNATQHCRHCQGLEPTPAHGMGHGLIVSVVVMVVVVVPVGGFGMCHR